MADSPRETDQQQRQLKQKEPTGSSMVLAPLLRTLSNSGSVSSMPHLNGAPFAS